MKIACPKVHRERVALFIVESVNPRLWMCASKASFKREKISFSSETPSSCCPVLVTLKVSPLAKLMIEVDALVTTSHTLSMNSSAGLR